MSLRRGPAEMGDMGVFVGSAPGEVGCEVPERGDCGIAGMAVCVRFVLSGARLLIWRACLLCWTGDCAVGRGCCCCCCCIGDVDSSCAPTRDSASMKGSV